MLLKYNYFYSYFVFLLLQLYNYVIIYNYFVAGLAFALCLTIVNAKFFFTILLKILSDKYSSKHNSKKKMLISRKRSFRLFCRTI